MRRWSSRTSLREGRADLIDGFVELSEEVSRNCCFSRGWHCLVCTGVIGGHTFWYLLGWWRHCAVWDLKFRGLRVLARERKTPGDEKLSEVRSSLACVRLRWILSSLYAENLRMKYSAKVNSHFDHCGNWLSFHLSFIAFINNISVSSSKIWTKLSIKTNKWNVNVLVVDSVSLMLQELNSPRRYGTEFGIAWSRCNTARKEHSSRKPKQFHYDLCSLWN